MPTKFLIRHAYAGDSAAWSGDDRLRPLQGEGPAEAQAIPRLLADHVVTCILSSPYVRCVETVEPLARALGRPIELCDDLADDAPASAVRERLRRAPVGAALCLHGHALREVLPGMPNEKGGIWVVRADGEEVEPLEYLSPVGPHHHASGTPAG